MSKPEHFGHAGLTGWRTTVADRLAPHAASRTPITEEQARGLLGAAFFALSLFYVVSTIARMVQAARD